MYYKNDHSQISLELVVVSVLVSTVPMTITLAEWKIIKKLSEERKEESSISVTA